MGADNAQDIVAEKQEKNIGHRWQPGESGNPAGRPKKGHSITEVIRSLFDEKPELKKALAAKILQAALDGDITAQKTIWNYMDGMPLQRNENKEIVDLALSYGIKRLNEPATEAGTSDRSLAEPEV